MKIYIRGRNQRVTDALRRHVETQLERLSRHYDRILEAHVTLRAERKVHIVDVTLHLPHYLMKAEERGKGFDEAIDLVRDRLERQIQKYKTRMMDKRHKPNGKARGRAPARERGAGTRIARTKRFTMRPMTAQEAAVQMEMLGHDFHVFLNADTEEVNVLYRRRGGDLGLIEPVL
jgi:putative sigma-54 modulation protein